MGEIPNIGTYSFKCDGYLVELAKSICEDISKNKADFKFHIGRIITGSPNLYPKLQILTSCCIRSFAMTTSLNLIFLLIPINFWKMHQKILI